jgi:hypothetical protein
MCQRYALTSTPGDTHEGTRWNMEEPRNAIVTGKQRWGTTGTVLKVTAREKDGGDTKKVKIARNTRVYYVIRHFILRRSTRRRACPVTRHAP